MGECLADLYESRWIPAFAGMTVVLSAIFLEAAFTPARHSRERGLRFTSAEPNIQRLSLLV